VVTDNLSSHTSVATREWLAEHPRIRQVFIPKGACWLNLQEGWWRLFRRQALAGQCFADTGEIAVASRKVPRKRKTSVKVLEVARKLSLTRTNSPVPVQAACTVAVPASTQTNSPCSSVLDGHESR
jgi:hypothetical protein